MRRSLGNLLHRKKKRAEGGSTTTHSAENSTRTTNIMPPLHVHLTPEAVASLPPPGLSGPSQLQWSPGGGKFLAFISSSAAVIRTARSPPALYRPLTGSNNNSNNSSNAPPLVSTPSSSASSSERVLMCMDVSDTVNIPAPQPLLSLTRSSSKRRMLEDALTLEERLRRERQRLTASSGSLTQFSWAWCNSKLRVMIPARGSVYIQEGVLQQQETKVSVQCIHDKQMASPAVDPQLSPDGNMVAWTAGGELDVKSATANSRQEAIRLTFGGVQSNEQCISHGIADFVAQEEMDRYRGFWWHPDSCGILLARVDESKVPLFRIMHQDADQTESGSTAYEDHRYPFAGKDNPAVKLAFVKIDKTSIVADDRTQQTMNDDARNDVEDVHMEDSMSIQSAQEIAIANWNTAKWFDPPREASEYLARVHWLPDGSAASHWQNRAQTVAVIMRMDLERGKARTLLVERSEVWINLHHMFKVLPKAIHPDDCRNTERNIPPIPSSMPPESCSFLFASERSGFSHLYLYTFCPGINGEQAVLLRTISAGEWMVESIVAIDMIRDAVYFTGTFDSPLERHMYALPITNSRPTEEEHVISPTEESPANPNGVRRGLSKVMNAFAGNKGRACRSQGGVWSSTRPVRLTIGSGMHSVAMDGECRVFADTSSDLDRPTSVKIYELADDIFGDNGSAGPAIRLVRTLYDASTDDKSLVELSSTQSKNGNSNRLTESLPPPELLEFPTVDGTETLHAALYRPDSRQHGPGPYPLVCAVYGGPHVQRVNRSWSQCSDMRAQRLRSLGFCVVKCDNRGSSRRGLAFESAIARRLGRLEVLDQVAAVRQLTLRGIVDPSRVGVYGWSYGGYLAAMCLCRAPDVYDGFGVTENHNLHMKDKNYSIGSE